MQTMQCPYCQQTMRRGKATLERSLGGKLLGEGNLSMLRFTPKRGERAELLDAAGTREAHFCDDCGTAVIRGVLADEQVQRCPACNETNPPNYEACWKCGAPL